MKAVAERICVFGQEGRLLLFYIEEKFSLPAKSKVMSFCVVETENVNSEKIESYYVIFSAVMVFRPFYPFLNFSAM